MKIFTTEAEQKAQRASKQMLARLLQGEGAFEENSRVRFEGELDVALGVPPGTVKISPQGANGIRIDIPMFLVFD